MTFSEEDYEIELKQLSDNAYGPDRYVIRALKVLIDSNKDLLTSNKQVINVIKDFNRATNESQKISFKLTIIGLLVAIAQIVLAIIIWRFH